jgi:hypothetical protein
MAILYSFLTSTDFNSGLVGPRRMERVMRCDSRVPLSANKMSALKTQYHDESILHFIHPLLPLSSVNIQKCFKNRLKAISTHSYMPKAGQVCNLAFLYLHLILLTLSQRQPQHNSACLLPDAKLNSSGVVVLQVL